MQKEEVVILHLVLFHIKRILESAGVANGHFKAYESLGISPVHINRSKSEHKKAVLLLQGISEVLRASQDKLLQDPRIRDSLEVAKIIAQ